MCGSHIEMIMIKPHFKNHIMCVYIYIYIYIYIYDMLNILLCIQIICIYIYMLTIWNICINIYQADVSI